MPNRDFKFSDAAAGEKVWCNGEFEIWKYPAGENGEIVFRVRSFDTQFGWRFGSAASALRAISAIRNMQDEIQDAARSG